MQGSYTVVVGGVTHCGGGGHCITYRECFGSTFSSWNSFEKASVNI